MSHHANTIYGENKREMVMEIVDELGTKVKACLDYREVLEPKVIIKLRRINNILSK